jgi:hypothetical protein
VEAGVASYRQLQHTQQGDCTGQLSLHATPACNMMAACQQHFPVMHQSRFSAAAFPAAAAGSGQAASHQLHDASHGPPPSMCHGVVSAGIRDPTHHINLLPMPSSGRAATMLACCVLVLSQAFVVSAAPGILPLHICHSTVCHTLYFVLMACCCAAAAAATSPVARPDESTSANTWIYCLCFFLCVQPLILLCRLVVTVCLCCRRPL